MAISEAQFRIVIAGTSVALVVAIASQRFCGSVTLPPKPQPPTAVGTTTKAIAAPAIYKEYLAKDAAAAGVAVPTLEEMSRAFPHHVDDTRRVLSIGADVFVAAGLRIGIARKGAAVVLSIENTLPAAVAYRVVTTPLPTIAGCNAAQPIAFDAIVLAIKQRATRVECAWRSGLSIAITRIETIELPPLGAWYVRQVPPAVVGVEPRIALGHEVPATRLCSASTSFALTAGLERGQITWRDLVDFYARYRCQTYHFPLDYRARP